MNIGFLLPFIIAAYGDDGLGRILLFDLSNGLLAFTLVYYLAFKHGKNGNSRSIFRKFVLSVPLWALLLAFGLNFGGITIEGGVYEFLKILGDLTVPLIMLALGLLFRPRFIMPLSLLSGILIRMMIGLALGYGLSLVFGLY